MRVRLNILGEILFARFRHWLAAVFVGVMAAGCASTAGLLPPAEQPLAPETVSLLDKKGMNTSTPIFVRIFKEESELEVWKMRDDGRFYHFKTYPICNWSGDLGPKTKQGDRQAPEGFYAVTREQMNPNSSFHLALNLGLPLRTPDGGLIFVFQTGAPLFRKYAADGRLEFERHIEGPQLDDYIRTLPDTWPARKAGDGTYPLIPPIVRTAAISPEGDLWVSLVPRYIYVYGPDGDKRRIVQIDATDPFSPTSLSFSRVSGATRALVTPGCYEFKADS